MYVVKIQDIFFILQYYFEFVAPIVYEFPCFKLILVFDLMDPVNL